MTSGEGGMVICADRELERRRPAAPQPGHGAAVPQRGRGPERRMTELQAAIGRVQLARLRGWNERRRPTRRPRRAPARRRARRSPPGAVHVYHQYTIRVPERPRRSARPNSASSSVSAAARLYPIPVHELPSFGLGLDLPETRRAAAEVLSLPVGPHVTDADADRIVHAVNSLV